MNLQKILKENYLIILILIFYTFLSFFRLGFNSLQSFDEAWYGSIARDLLKRPDFLKLTYNTKLFNDHPPLIIWLMALSYKIFGISEFSTRLVSALSGVLSVTLIYLIGKKLFNKYVGLSASLMLCSSLWFILRTRSGNLDIPFLVFYLLTIYLAILAAKENKFLPWTFVSFACLILAKTLVGFSALVLIIFQTYPLFLKFKQNKIIIYLSLLSFILLIAPWYLYNIALSPGFLKHYFLEIGLRGGTNLSFDFSKQFLYLRSGIGKWYSVFFTSLLSIVLLFKKFKDKNFIFICLWIGLIALPFFINAKTEVWHLIPFYPLIFLLSSFLLYEFGKKLTKIFLRLLPSLCRDRNDTILNYYNFIYISLIALIAFYQLYQSFNLVIPQSNYFDDEADISSKASKYGDKIYLDDVFLPEAVFYSNRFIVSFGFDLNSLEKSLNVLEKETNPILIIKKQDLELFGKNLPIKILDKNNSYYVITKEKNE
ncbi:phospholipid carrier-dependent glycosyltransferase [Candidatus Beckwithbacteria bacterium]|nr:phospholipid carrier-dependent glycosyltransferase [Candidatus Beckwithbacteria bacterium]